MRPALLPLLLLAATVSGCVNSYTISRTELGDLELLDERMRGRQATIELTDGTREEGRVLFVRADSSAWHYLLVRRAVPTDGVVQMIRRADPGHIRRGVLIGAGIGAAIGALVLVDDSGFLDGEEYAVGAVAGGAAWGLIAGVLSGAPRAYVLTP